MRRQHILGWIVCGAAGLAAAANTGLDVPDADALRQLLLRERTPAQLAALAPRLGCTEGGACSVNVGDLVITLPEGGFRTTGGRRVRLSGQHASKLPLPLPKADWQPLAAYTVSMGDATWGLCMEFSHTGLGKSGSAQRWSSVVLVPFVAGLPGPVAHRFVGYWAACEHLWQPAGAPGRVALPLLVPANSPAPADALDATPWLCAARACVAGPPERRFVAAPELPGGGLRWVR